VNEKVKMRMFTAWCHCICFKTRVYYFQVLSLEKVSIKRVFLQFLKYLKKEILQCGWDVQVKNMVEGVKDNSFQVGVVQVPGFGEERRGEVIIMWDWCERRPNRPWICSWNDGHGANGLVEGDVGVP
jgi:hypothetical protein